MSLDIDDDDPREQISRIEIHIEELAEASKRCRKIILFSKFVIALGGLILVAMVLQAIRFDPIAMIGAIAAIVGGVVIFGSNTSTLRQTAGAMKAVETLRTELISKIELRVVSRKGQYVDATAKETDVASLRKGI